MPEKKITVSFRKAPDYRLYAATGAWGGPTNDGHIWMNITVDHAAIPSYHSLALTDDGTVNPQEPIDAVASGDVEKDVLCGILLSPQSAKSIASWLNDQADRVLGGK